MVALYSFERLSKSSVTMTTCTVASLASSGKRLDALAEAVEVGADGVVERNAAAGTSSIATSSSAALWGVRDPVVEGDDVDGQQPRLGGLLL